LFNKFNKRLLTYLYVAYPKFAYIRTYAACFRICDRIFLNIFLSNVVLKPLNIFGKIVQNRPINNHDYDSPSLKVAYARNMRKNMPHCRIYAPHILVNFAYFPAYFASESSSHFKKIFY